MSPAIVDRRLDVSWVPLLLAGLVSACSGTTQPTARINPRVLGVTSVRFLNVDALLPIGTRVRLETDTTGRTRRAPARPRVACPRQAPARSQRAASDPRAEEARGLDGDGVRRYLTWMRTRVSSKGQIVLPAEVRRQDRVLPGQEFEVERLDRGDYRLVRRASRPNEGVVDWLLACPEKGFFVPIESESTDSL